MQSDFNPKPEDFILGNIDSNHQMEQAIEQEE